MTARNHSENAQPADGADKLPESVTQPLGEIDPYLQSFIRSTSGKGVARSSGGESGSSTTGLPANLQDAILYSLLGPGKRIRPLLTVHCFRIAYAQATGTSPSSDQPALAAAAAVEMVHAFSLIHDDLPGIDNDDMRRGRPTLHRKAGEAMAILAGDSLLTLAFTILVRNYSPELASRLVAELADGTNGMIAGQIFDTLGGFEPGLSDQQKIEQVHTNKTGALIRAACRMGALVGVAEAAAASAILQNSSKLVESITVYADAIGLMFQVMDDVLDVTQSSEQLGKKAGKDQDAGKLTYPGVLGLERSRELIETLNRRALQAVQGLGPVAEPLAQLSRYLAVRTK